MIVFRVFSLCCKGIKESSKGKNLSHIKYFVLKKQQSHAPLFVEHQAHGSLYLLLPWQQPFRIL